MKVFNSNDLATLEALLKLPQDTLKRTMKLYLDKCYDKVVDTPMYTYAVGDIPIALVAHLDTVFRTTPNDIYYDKSKGVLWSPTGAGFDDRAGVFAIVKILKSGLRPHVIFTTDEEKGGIGASMLGLADPFAQMKYIIELDRHGKNDCVFYQCDNPEFVDYVESFGFLENWGTFSDISEICPAWEIAGVNLSIGYEDEHTVAETLHVNAFLSTVDKVIKMLKEADTAPNFKYIPYIGKYQFGNQWYKNIYGEGFISCSKCKHHFSEYEVIPVKGLDDSTKFYCPDCIASSPIQWCTRCCEAVEVKKRDYSIKDFVCKDCKKEATASNGND